MMKNKTLFIFDVDGTLVNAFVAIQRSLNYTRKKFGYSPVGFQKAKREVGHGDRRFIESFFREEHVDEALRVFKKHHEKSVVRYSKVLPNARLVLSRLKQKGKRLAVATNRPRRFTRLILKKLDLIKYLDVILCADEVKSYKPKPKILNTILEKLKVGKKDAVFVGDMDIDMETAKRAKIQGVFVKGGAGFASEVEHFPRIQTIPNLKKILTYLD